MVRFFLSTAALFLLWLGLSGVYKPLIIGLGLGAAVIAIALVRRMDKMDGMGTMRLDLRPLALVGYWLWLCWQIAQANWQVARIILGGAAVRQKFFQTPYAQRTDMGATIFANSITLTPGTITIEVGEDAFWVHALSYSDADAAALSDMDARVCAVEAVESGEAR